MVGLGLRLVCHNLYDPWPIVTWYVPFIQHSMDSGFSDSWGTWVNNGGDVRAFPYGIPMLLAFGPGVKTLGLLNVSPLAAYKACLTVWDVALLVALIKSNSNKRLSVLIMCWLSPVYIVCTYVLGFNDTVPATLTFLSYQLMCKRRYALSAFLLAIGVSAKFSMILALPFLVMFVYSRLTTRHNTLKYLVVFVITVVLCMLPVLTSSTGYKMFTSNGEILSVITVPLITIGDVSVYLLPIYYISVLYVTWKLGRVNEDIFATAMASVFLGMAVFSPSAPGWMIWSVPYLVSHAFVSDKPTTYLLYTISILAGFTSVIYAPKTVLDISTFSRLTDSSIVHSGLYTLLCCLTLLLLLRIWRHSVIKNDYFLIRRSPFIVGICGDSSTGKDTLTAALINVLGSRNVSTLCGDDYHYWDRQRPTWRLITHLNPLANDLTRFHRDIYDLSKGNSVKVKHYDHQSGKVTTSSVIHSRDFIISQGLHTLYNESLRSNCDLKVYVGMDHRLKSILKYNRDVTKRGYTYEQVKNSMLLRSGDFHKYIVPQSLHADLILHLEYQDEDLDGNAASLVESRMLLRVTSRLELDVDSIRRSFITLSNGGITIHCEPNRRDVQYLFAGDFSKGDVEEIYGGLCLHLPQFLDDPPRWESGLVGVMQLFIVLHLDFLLGKRREN